MNVINIKLIRFFLLFSSVAIFSCKKNSSPQPTPTSTVNLSNGLLAYYAFSGSAIDSSVNHLNGIEQSGISYTTDEKGNANSAVAFDGFSGFILVPDSNNLLAPDSVSIAFWFNLSNVTYRSALVNKVNYNDASGLSYGVNVSSPDSARVNFTTVGAGYDCSSHIYDASSIVIDNGTNILPNTWYHVVAIFASSVQKIYINGQLASSVNRSFSTQNVCSNNKTLQIGGWWSGDIISAQGKMDELRIYNRSLNQDEINELSSR